MQYQFLPNTPADEADIIILPVAYEDTVSAKVGTRHAPAAILKATEQIEYYDEEQQWSPMKHMKISVENELSKLDSESIEAFNAKVRHAIAALPPSCEKLFIGLGGEHSITPLLTSERMKEPGTIIFLDAHADLRKSYMGSEYSHACPSHHLLEQGHKMIMIGVRSLFEKEAERVERDENIAFFGDRALQKKEVKKELLQMISSLEGQVWLSIDMDAFNPALVPGVGTPQPGGLEWYFTIDILEALFLDSSAKIAGVDILELVPEPTNVSQVFAAKLLQKIISFWGKSNDFDNKPMTGAQMQVAYH